MIPFNIPSKTGNEKGHIEKAINSNLLSGNGKYTKLCESWFEKSLNCKKALMTSSCTHALEMAALLLDIKEGDEVIMPSFTFSSTANAFILRGAKIVFVDIRPDTLNIDETRIEEAITKKTKAIVPVHYAGVGCEMDVIIDIVQKHDLFVVEDAAQGMMSTYKGKPLGTIGHVGTYSFHESKNYTSGGEGGALLFNDERFIERAEIIREKGTNRTKFFRGEIDKYTWLDIGSSYLPSELQSAYLWGQLEYAHRINEDRLNSWSYYYEGLKDLEKSGFIKLPDIPADCEHNAHIFYLLAQNEEERTELLKYLKKNGINAVFHYIPLHSSPAGQSYGRVFRDMEVTNDIAKRVVRLPMYYSIGDEAICFVIKRIVEFFTEVK